MRVVTRAACAAVAIIIGSALMVSACSPTEKKEVFAAEDASLPPATVDIAPAASISAPLNGAVVVAGTPIVLMGTASDAEDAPGDLMIRWTANTVEEPLYEGAANALGGTKIETSALGAGPHVITLTAIDSAGQEGSASVDVVVNTAPTSASVAILPAAPRAGDDLTAAITAAASDVNRVGGDLTYQFAWFRDGEATGVSTETLSSTLTLKGEVWEVRAWAFDGFETGPVSVATVTIGNTAPTCAKASMFPTAGTTSTSFECSCLDRFDADAADDSAALDTCSFFDGTNLIGDGECVLAAAATTKGMALTCVYTPSDGADTGSPAESSPIPVLNEAPTMPGAAVAPGVADADTDLTCIVATAATDADGDSLMYEVSWVVNGYENTVSLATVRAGDLSSDENGTPARKDDAVRCRVRAFDGAAFSTPADSEPVTLQNASPQLGVAMVVVDGAVATELSTLECAVPKVVDADGDTVALSYGWTVNGAPVVGQTGMGLTGEHFNKGDQVACLVSATDGMAATGPTPSKNSIVIANALPTLTGVALTPSETTPQGILTCTPEGWVDPDGDALEVNYVWHISTGAGTSPIAGQSGAVFYPVGLNAGAIVTCQATPRNGLELGSPVVSGPAAIVAPVPTAAVVKVSAPQGAGGVVSCVLVSPAKYVDGDVTYTWFFQVNGQAPIAGSATLAGLTDCDMVACWAQAQGAAQTLKSEVAELLLPVGQDCDDGNVCTSEGCAAVGGCVSSPSTGNACDDGNPCTTGDVCQTGTCTAGGFAATSQACDDGKFCTGQDHCDGLGGCQGGADPCLTAADGCVVGACDPIGSQCKFANKADGAGCSDANGCTTADSCLAGICVPGAPVDCSDENEDVCTEGVCKSLDGANHTCLQEPKPAGLDCDDGDFCSVATTCDGAGGCGGGKARDCAAEAGDACNGAFCDAFDQACVAFPKADGADCDDGSTCTLTDACQGGQCVGAENTCVEEPISVSNSAGRPVMLAPLGFGRYVAGWYGATTAPHLHLRRSDRFGSREDLEVTEVGKSHPTTFSASLTSRPGGVHFAVSLDFNSLGCANWSSGTGSAVGYLYAHDGSLLASKKLLGLSVACKYASNGEITGSRAVPLAFPGGGHGLVYSQQVVTNWGTATGSPGNQGVWLSPPGSTTNDLSMGAPIALATPVNGSPIFDATVVQDGTEDVLLAYPSHYEDLTVRRFSLAGVATGAVVVLKTSSKALEVRLKTLGSGQLLVTWRSAEGIMLQLLEPDLTPLTGGINVANGGGLHLGDVAVLSDDGFVVAYDDAAGDAVGYAVKARRFTKTGGAIGKAFVVNTFANGNQYGASVVALENDEFVVAYRDGAGAVWTRRFDHDGAPIPGRLERRVNTTKAGDQVGADAARVGEGAGNALVVYESPLAGKEDGEILGRIVDSLGEPVGDEVHLNVSKLGHQGQPAVAGGPGFFAVLWETPDAEGGTDIALQLRSSTGQLIGDGETMINEAWAGDQTDGALATAGPDGDLLVTWSTDASGDGDIVGRIVASNGDVITGDLLVGGGEGIDGLSAVAGHPTSAQWAVVWQAEGADDSGTGVLLRKVDPSGAVGEAVVVNLETSLDQARPTVAISPDGAADVVCWEADSHPDDMVGSIGIACRILAWDDLSQISTEFIAHVGVAGDQMHPQVRYLQTGGLVVSWTDEGSDSDGQSIGVQRFTSMGAAAGPSVVANRTWVGDQFEPFMTPLSPAAYLVGWHSMDQDGDGSGVITRVLPTF